MLGGLRRLRWHILASFSLILILGTTWTYREPLHAKAQQAFGAAPMKEPPSMQMSTDDASAGYDLAKSFFQAPLDWFEMPAFNTTKLREYPARNYKGPGHETFATFFATRESTKGDGYFLATQQIIYRLLWDPPSMSVRYPVTVFVAPFVEEWQRDYFRAAGALVRELPLHPFTPEHPGVAGRLQDMFSKLELWRQHEFSRIAYLDGDAFPVKDIDIIFDMAPEQECKADLLPEEDKEARDGICKYTFAAYCERGTNINAGVIVFNPNEPMYQRLSRMTLDNDKFDNGLMEQSLLNYAYDKDGPFPPSTLPHAFNGGSDLIAQGKPVSILHAKLWATYFVPDDAWEKNKFESNWKEMLTFYASETFEKLRTGESDKADA